MMACTSKEETLEEIESSLMDLCQGTVDSRKMKTMSYDGIVNDVFRLCENSIGGPAVGNIIVTVDLTNSDDEDVNECLGNSIEENVTPCPHRHWDDMNIPYVSQLNCEDSHFDFLANWLKINYFSIDEPQEMTSNNLEDNALQEAKTEPTSPCEPNIPERDSLNTDELLRSVSDRLKGESNNDDEDDCIIEDVIIKHDWKNSLINIKPEPRSPSPPVVREHAVFAPEIVKAEPIDACRNPDNPRPPSSNIFQVNRERNSMFIKSEKPDKKDKIDVNSVPPVPPSLPQIQVPEKPSETIEGMDELEGIKQELQNFGVSSSPPTLNIDNNEKIKEEEQNSRLNEDLLVEFEAVVDNVQVDQKFNFDVENYDNDGFVKLPTTFSFDVDDNRTPAINPPVIEDDFTQDVPTGWHELEAEFGQSIPAAISSDDESASRASPLSFQAEEIADTPALDCPVSRPFANIFEKFSRAPPSPARTELIGDDYLSIFGDETEFGDDDEYLTANDVNEELVSASTKKSVFVSEDPKENDDNNDPEWQVMERLKTDDERYRVVRMRWKNLFPPDPSINLTTHNFWKKRLQSEGRDVLNLHGKRVMPNDGGGVTKRMRLCTEGFNKHMDDYKTAWDDERKLLKADFRKRKWMLELELKRQKYQLERTYHAKREENGCDLFQLQQFMVDKKKRMEVEYKYTFDKLQEIHSKNMELLRKKYKTLIERVQTVSDEVLTFQSYYSCLKNSSTANVDTTFISDERFQEMDETEEMYKAYDRNYV